MTKTHHIYVLVKCVGLIFTVSGLIGLITAMPAVEDSDMDTSHALGDKVETFKKDILNRLGYARPPNVSNMTHSIEEKRRMIQQYRNYIKERDILHKHPFDDIEDDSIEMKIQSKTFYSLDYKGERPSQIDMSSWHVPDSVRLYFNPDLDHPAEDHTKELYIHSAKLQVFIKDARPDNLRDTHTVDKQIRINVYQILSIKNSTSFTRTLIDSQLLPLITARWANFEIGKAVQSWINSKDTNLGIEIAAESQDINDVVDIDVSHTVLGNTNTAISLNATKTSPSVHVYAETRSILKRVKRRSRKRGDCKQGDGNNKCCRYPIKISFKDIGWDDWIIAPLDYTGYYCAGKCPYRHKAANTFAQIKALLHLNNPDKVPSPCCVATKLSPFTILHYDINGRYTFSDYKDLVVEQCRCG